MVELQRGQVPYDVFVKMRHDSAFEHVGSVRASDDLLALQWAKEIYTRRSACAGLWVVPRSAITASRPDDAELFRRGFEKEYRRPGYFTGRRRALSQQISGAELPEEVPDDH